MHERLINRGCSWGAGLKAQSEFNRNALIMIVGAALAQGLPALVSPILTRIYDPASFGVFAVFTSLAAVLSVICGGRYEMAIMVPRNNVAATNIMVLSVAVAVLISLVAGAYIFAAPRWHFDFLGDSKIYKWLWAVPLSALFIATFRSGGYWLGRHKNFAFFSKIRILQGIAICVLSIALGLTLQSGPGGLILGALGAQLTVATIALYHILRRTKYKPSLSRLRAQAYRYRKYPTISMPSALLDTFTQQLPVLWLANIFDATTVGFYNLGIRVITAPVSIISASVGQVYMQRIAECINKNPSRTAAELRIAFTKLLVIGCVAFLPIFFFGDPLFGWIFGEQWRIAGVYCEILSVSTLVKFVVSPLSTVFVVAERHWMIARWQMTYLCVTVMALYLGSSYSMYNMLWLLAATDVFLYALYLYLMIRLTVAISNTKD